jgi:hypothetical protein
MFGMHKLRTVGKREADRESNGCGAVCPNVSVDRKPTLAATPIRS